MRLMIKPPTATYEHIRVTYGQHTSTHDWHTDEIQVHTNTSDMGVTYEYIRVTNGWCTSQYEWHADDIRVTYLWHASTYKWNAMKYV